MDERNLSLLDYTITERLMRKVVNPKREDHLLSYLSLLDNNGLPDKRGMKILSSYPYFGSGKSPRPAYPSIIFSFVLSVSTLFEHKRDPISSFFPGEDKDKITRLVLIIHKAYKKIGIIKESGRIDIDTSSQFMSLSISDRLSFLLSSLLDEDKESMKKAIGYILYINGLEKDKLDEVLDDINTALGLTVTSSLLTDFCLLNEKNGRYTSSFLPEKEERGIYTLSSDMTLTYQGTRDDSIYLIADPLLFDKGTTRWIITKSSIKKALDLAIGSSDILSILSSYSTYNIPENIKTNIESWEREYRRVRIRRGIVITVDCSLSPLFDTDGMKEYIVEKLSDESYILDSMKEDEWRSILFSYGLTMLPESTGPEMAKEREKENVSFSPLPEFINLPSKREIEWNREESLKYERGITNPYERLLFNEHLSFSPSDIQSYEYRDGLEYQEKRELVHDALKKGEPIVITDIHEKYRLVNPVSLEGDIFNTNDKSYSVSSLWKIYKAPPFIKKKKDLDL